MRNKTRLPSGASDFKLVVGDYTNPILKVTLVYAHDSDFRVVPLNQPHAATVVPSIRGDSSPRRMRIDF